MCVIGHWSAAGTSSMVILRCNNGVACHFDFVGHYS